MSAPDTVDLGLIAIAIMAAASFLIRAGGFWLMGHITITLRVRRVLEALPGSIVVAVVLPIAVKSGAAGMLAIAAAIAAMFAFRNTLVGVVLGVTIAAAVRRLGI
jgi:uncharacterized membrane protein